MFQLFLFLSLFFFLPSDPAQAKKTKVKGRALHKKNLEAEKSASLMELLNDTDQLKNEIKRDLAEGEQEQLPSPPASKKKMIQFGNMKLSISERKEEDLKNPHSNKKQAKRLNPKL